MPDRKKVINGLKHCTRKIGYNTCDGCPYEKFDCIELKHDALELLEAQSAGMARLTNAVENAESWMQTAPYLCFDYAKELIAAAKEVADVS